MILKNRRESEELKILRSLNARASLDENGRNSYHSAEKGYEGEVLFDERVTAVRDHMVFINDLLLEHQGSEFQIDSLAVSSRKIFHFEVKNYEGDFLIDEGKWRSPSGKEIKNPILQVSRAASLIRQITEQAGFRYPVESYLIFVNPEFHLDNPPAKTRSIVYPAQLNRFIYKLQNQPLKISKSDIRLGEKLLSLHKESSDHSRIPEYKFEELRKGIICPGCGEFYQEFNRLTVFCQHCKGRESCGLAVFRTVEEFRLLFPGLKITNNLVYGICDGLLSKKTIYRILSQHYKKIGYGNHSYYIDCNKNID
ncbi:nuclease-related domain-containing protein [Bacillus salacetis]|uniref:nuclease-related domain-containing protein n=1 Tax=Bacillus salacetis TaxID=2315464 RepID=UPI003BA10E22